MGEIPEFPVEKLWAPIEDLGLNLRAYHALKRAKVLTVADVVSRGPAGMMSLRNVGTFLTTHILAQAASFLGITVDGMFSDDVRELIMQEHQILVRGTSGVIANARNDSSNAFPYTKWSYVSPFSKATSASRPQEPRKSNVAEYLPAGRQDLGSIFSSLSVNERAWLAVELKAIRLLTLVEVASEIGGVTRERIRQIITGVEGKVNKNLELFRVYFDFLESTAIVALKALPEDSIEMSTLVHQLRKNLANSNLAATDKQLERLIAIVRMLAMHGESVLLNKMKAKWRHMIFLCCLVDPPIEKYEKVGRYVNKQRKEQKNLSYAELAHLVLSKSGKPLHWSAIANQAYRLHRRKAFDTRALYNALLFHEDLFVRVGQGTYELAEWGSTKIEPYPDIIASILRQENHAIAFELILARMSSIRSIKRPSLMMYVDMHPRFYKSINNTYGLRGWLPPREMQNLRTPEWLIEDTKSFERVERARQRGYDVESIVAQDKLR